MVGTLIEKETEVCEALNYSDSCRLVPSDGEVSCLAFQQMRASVHEETGLHVEADAPEGLHGAFNARCAHAETRAQAMDQGITPDLVLAQQQTMNLTNG